MCQRPEALGCGKSLSNWWSEASSLATKHGKLVTISDEAFALLLYDNYNEKWARAFQREQEEQQRLETLASPPTASAMWKEEER